MAFLDLKALKQNLGAKLKLTLQSTGVYQQKTYNGQSFNVFDYEVLQDNKLYTLGTSDALHRKLQPFKVGDSFHLSWEEFTKDGELRNYWKVEIQPQDDSVKQTSNGVNEFEQKLKNDQASKAVTQKSNTFESGAKTGMLFNQTMEQFRYFKCTWTQQEFVDNFNRLSSYLYACENQSEKPNLTKPKQVSSPPVNQPIEIKEDDLPF